MWSLTDHLPAQLSGHLGANISALIDGQLEPEREARAWEHVVDCADCQQRVQAETWIKRRMAGLCSTTDAEETLDGAVYARMSDAASWAGSWEGSRAGSRDRAWGESWAEGGIPEPADRRRRAPMIALGAGSVGLAVLGLMAFTSAPAGRGEVTPPRPSVQANINGGITSNPPGPVTAGFNGAGTTASTTTTPAVSLDRRTPR